MHCNQCEETLPKGCTKIGVCGKTEDVASLQDILIYALKGISAYTYHAAELGYRSESISDFTQEALFSTLTNVNFSAERFIQLNLKAGEKTLEAMELLDKAHVETFGTPVPAQVSTGTVEGPGILVTGHDLKHLYELLKQAKEKGVNVYTHSEMLPAHGYPKLKEFDNLVGNYGGSWVDQRDVFESFPGAILGTTNCVLSPRESYRDRIFTSGIAGLNDVTHIADNDFSAVINKALELPPLKATHGGTLTTGFHYSNILALAPQIIEAVKAGKIKRFFVVAGCDCPGNDMDYYKQLVKLIIPEDGVILSLACGKFRFNDEDYGSIDGIPRFLDIGQCNNAYSAIKIAGALAEAFGCGVNDLPLSIVLSWFEQKAVAILLSLFNLGIKGIRIGPKPPAFVSEGVFQVLQDNFDLKLVNLHNPKKDLSEMLGKEI